MVKVTRKVDESLDSLLARFRRAVNNANILADIKKHEYYEKPGVARRHRIEENKRKRDK